MISKKILEMRFSVIPAKAGIQSFQIVINCLDSGFHRSDDFLRIHQVLAAEGDGTIICTAAPSTTGTLYRN